MTDRAIENLTDAVAEQIAFTLEEIAREQRAFDARALELESQGYRIINDDGGVIDRSSRWEITDWRTGEVLAKGRGSKSYDNLQRPHNWYHVDHVHNDTGVHPIGTVEGLPESLAETIIYWTFDHEEEARALAASTASP